MFPSEEGSAESYESTRLFADYGLGESKEL
jgi:hypothetical protein